MVLDPRGTYLAVQAKEIALNLQLPPLPVLLA